MTFKSSNYLNVSLCSIAFVHDTPIVKNYMFGSCIIHILYTGCAKIKKNNSGVKRLICQRIFRTVGETQERRYLNGETVSSGQRTVAVQCELCSVRCVVQVGQVRLGQVRLSQVRLGQGRLGQVRLGYVRLGQVRLGQVRLSQVRLGQVRLCQVRLGQVRLG